MRRRRRNPTIAAPAPPRSAIAPNHRRFSSFIPEVPPAPVAGNPDGTTSVVVVVAGTVVVVAAAVVFLARDAVVVALAVFVVGLAVVVVGLTVVVVGLTVVVVGLAVVVVGLAVVVVGLAVVVVGLTVVVVGLTVVVVGLAVVVVVGADTLQVGTVIVFESKVTAPFWASSRPATVAPVSSVIDVNARVVPTKLVFVPSVSELPTTQKTLQAWAPFSSKILLDDAVITVDAASKMKTVDGSPCPLSVSVPVSPKVPAAEL